MEPRNNPLPRVPPASSETRLPSIAAGWAAAAVHGADTLQEQSACGEGRVQLVSRVARGETEPPDVSVHRQPGWLCLEPGVGHAQSGSAGTRKGRAREVWAKCLGSRRVLWAAKAQRTNTPAGSETRAERCNGRAAQCTPSRVAGRRYGVCVSSKLCRVSSVCIFGVYLRCIFACIFVFRRGRNLEAWRAVVGQVGGR